MIGFSGSICVFVIFLRSITTLNSFYFLRSIGTLNTLNFLRSNTTQLSKSPDIYTTQNVYEYATGWGATLSCLNVIFVSLVVRI